MAMHASGLQLEREAREAAQKKAAGYGAKIGLSPAALKRKLAAKKAAARKAKEST
jgi:hypothetical protein